MRGLPDNALAAVVTAILGTATPAQASIESDRIEDEVHQAVIRRLMSDNPSEVYCLETPDVTRTARLVLHLAGAGFPVVMSGECIVEYSRNSIGGLVIEKETRRTGRMLRTSRYRPEGEMQAQLCGGQFATVGRWSGSAARYTLRREKRSWTLVAIVPARAHSDVALPDIARECIPTIHSEPPPKSGGNAGVGAPAHVSFHRYCFRDIPRCLEWRDRVPVQAP